MPYPNFCKKILLRVQKRINSLLKTAILKYNFTGSLPVYYKSADYFRPIL